MLLRFLGYRYNILLLQFSILELRFQELQFTFSVSVIISGPVVCFRGVCFNDVKLFYTVY